MSAGEITKLANELGQAETDYQAAERYHLRRRTELSRAVYRTARQRLIVAMHRVESIS